MQISIFDLEVNNIKSIYNAAKLFGDVNIVKNFKQFKKADVIILPGNGSFDTAMKVLNENSLSKIINNYFYENKKIIGICLGLQLFMTSSEEGTSKGLNLIKGKTIKIKNKSIKTPMLGWYDVSFKNNYFKNNNFFFNNNYMVSPEEDSCVVGYMEDIPVFVQKKKFTGLQFHPEKSSEYGLELLKKIILD